MSEKICKFWIQRAWINIWILCFE